MKNATRFAAFATLIALAGGAFAQDDSSLSAEDLAAKFKSQADQMTRGLVIAPSEGTANTNATADSGTAKLPANTSYVALDPKSQVNIQIEFAFDSAAIGDGQMEKLTTLCEVMKSSDIPSFKIIGHTDSSGTDSYNQNLSKLRAEEVKRHLVEDCGIPADKLVAEGVGEAFPADPKNPKADVNRRVEFQVGS